MDDAHIERSKEPMTTPFPQESEQKQLIDLLQGKEMIVCYGAGGVGKTTTSAALGIKAALMGRRVLVLTIDPARRLCDTLHISDEPEIPHAISAEEFKAVGAELKGALSIWMVQPGLVFDRAVREIASSPENADKLQDTRIYKALRSMVSGMQEYMAGESLYQFITSHDYDLIVLDTPPSRNAVDFLMAPDQLLGFFDSRIIKLFAPSTGRFSIFGRARKILQNVFQQVAGGSFIAQLQEFVSLLLDSVDVLRDHAQAIQDLLTSSRTGHMLIASPSEDAIDEMIYFQTVLQQQQIQPNGSIINRSLTHQPTTTIEQYTEQNPELSLPIDEITKSALEKLSPFVEQEHHLAEKHRQTVRRLRKQSPPQHFILAAPHLGHEIEDLYGLVQLAQIL